MKTPERIEAAIAYYSEVAERLSELDEREHWIYHYAVRDALKWVLDD